MRARFLTVLAVVFLMPMAMAPAISAQEATPASGFGDIDLPRLDVTMTAATYEGIPDEIEAGRYLVNLTVDEDVADFGGGIAFVQAPEGMDSDEFIQAYMTPPDESGVGEVAGTPIVGAEASPVGGVDETGGLPSFLFEATYAGGVYTFSGGPAQVVLDLTPGEWIAWTDDPSMGHEPIIFQVTGEMPAELPEPDADATIVMGEYVIEVAEGQLTSGTQVLRIDNIGAQPHFIGWFQGPDGMTEDQIQVVLEEEQQAMMTGTPPAWSGINPETDLMPVTFTATQSGQTSMWITVDLQAGTHGLICFFPDISDGLEHAYHGMYSVIEVGD